MVKLKLARGLSYTGYNIKATKKEPFVEVEDEATANYLVESKHFELVMNTESGRKTPPDDNVPSEQWTVPQLQAFAAEKEIDITGLKLKPEIFAKVQEALSEGNRINFDEDK